MEPHEIRVRLALYEFEETPEELTSALGITPDRTFRKGERPVRPPGLPPDPRVYEYNGWVIESMLPSEVDDPVDGFEKHVEAVLKRIEPGLEKFTEAAQRCYCELAVVLELRPDSEASLPSVAFDKQTLRTLAMIGANIDFDLYVF
ncbi:MAG TPA: DUF4279 domain-containing protein [Candidatus Kapabacteria bacterium]|jgi:hypothetical protein|nr:DUF4279 domain-containing protein [Candidatus Kapabacteria bacterium]